MKNELHYRMMSAMAILSFVMVLIAIFHCDKYAAERDQAMEQLRLCRCKSKTGSSTSTNFPPLYGSGIEPVPQWQSSSDSTCETDK